MTTVHGRCLAARATHASHRALFHGLGLSVGIAIALSGCAQPQPDELGYWDAPTDPQVYTAVLNRCLTVSHGPERTVYNDWDEAIDACGKQADRAARYCPTGTRCWSGLPTHEAVRSVLASGMSASGQDPKGLEAKPASPAPKGDAQ